MSPDAQGSGSLPGRGAGSGAETPRTQTEAGPSGSSSGLSAAGAPQTRPAAVVRASSSQAALLAAGTADLSLGAGGSAAMSQTLSAGAEPLSAVAPAGEDTVAPLGRADRRMDERIMSRAVDPSRWNWEAERARMEQAADGGASSSGLPTGPPRPPPSRQGSMTPDAAGNLPEPTGAARRAADFGTQRSGAPALSSSPSGGAMGPPPSRPQPPRIDTTSPPLPRSSAAGGSMQGMGASSPLSSSADVQPVSSPVPSSSTQGPQQQHAGRRESASKERSGSGPLTKKDQSCDACKKPMTGQFVRALGVVYHLDCFRCRDCNKVVAAKFFPATDDMGQSSPAGSSNSGSNHNALERKMSPTTGASKLFPLCETDYFRRLDLICANCSGALRGSYITALGKKFHVEHFTCSICPTVFGPQDSYYEHDGRVFCHFHYSTRFAIRCTGCRTAILKQFVEINRNNQDEHWHPECYMIHKFWNIKLCPTGSTPKDAASIAAEPTMLPGVPEPTTTGVAPATSAPASSEPTTEALETEANETPSSLKQKQRLMEEQVYRIWTVLSAFEESSAACISDMLRHVSSGRYLGGVRMAERFILHVEILFSAIDDLEKEARKEGAKGISHIREARMLCKKIVNFFSLLSHTQETGAQRMGITQELLSLVTGLAHYLKILIRIALTGALKLDREYENRAAISWFLNQLAFLAREGNSGSTDNGTSDDGKSPTSAPSSAVHDNGQHGPSDSRTYGYRSLPRSTSPLASEGGESATDLCVACSQTVEEECVRMGIYLRWHSSCLRCATCRRPTQRDPSSSRSKAPEPEPSPDLPPALPASQFTLETTRRAPTDANGSASGSGRPGALVRSAYCPDCQTPNSRPGFESVSRLEQYAFLLRVALNRLYALLKKRGVVPPSPPSSQHADLPPETAAEQAADLYKDTDIKRVTSVNLDRKLSTKARVPHISTVVGSPSGQQTQGGSIQQRASPTEMGQQDPRRSPRPPRSPSPGQWDTGRAAGAPSQQQASYQSQQQQQHQQQQQQQLHQQQQHQQQQYQQQQQWQASQSGRASPNKQPGSASRDVSPNRQAQSGGKPAPPLHYPPPIPAQQQQQQSHQQLSQQLSQQHAPGSIVPIRPAFARHNTDVRIRDDGPMRQPSGDDITAASLDAVTLADIPQLLEAEQAREQHRSLPSEGGRSLSELSALELFIVKHMAVMMIQQSALRDLVNLDDLVDFIEMRKNTFWGKLFKGGKDDKKIKKKGVFGIPLEVLVERNGADSTLGATATQLRVPSFVDDIVSAMRQMDMSIEGIFRKNGNIRRLATSAEALDRDSSTVNLSDDNPVQLAALLKKFLRELPDPLLTFKLHRMFVMAQKIEPESERRRILHLVTVLLPKAHRDTMEVLFVFLKWVASFSHIDEETGSKMDLQNLATVLGPNILYSKGTDPAKDETFLANRAVLNLLEHQDDFWKVPIELEAVLQDRELLSGSAELTSRDIIKRCEKHAKRARAGTGPSMQMGPGQGQGQGQQGGQGRGMLGGGQQRWVDGANRHQPDLHAPATMRQVGSDQAMNYSRSQGNGGSGAPMGHMGSSSSFPRSPVSEDPRGTPWGANFGGGQQPQHYHQQQQHQQQHGPPHHQPPPPPHGYGASPYGSPTQPPRDQGAPYNSSFGRVPGEQTPQRSGTPQGQFYYDGDRPGSRSQQALEQRSS